MWETTTMRLQCNGVFRSVIGAEVLVMLRLPESRCVHEIFVGTDHQRILHQSHCLMMLLPAPAPKEPMQGVRGREHLPAPTHQEPMQGVPRGGGYVDAGRPGGARGGSACCRLRPVTCHMTHMRKKHSFPAQRTVRTSEAS